MGRRGKKKSKEDTGDPSIPNNNWDRHGESGDLNRSYRDRDFEDVPLDQRRNGRNDRSSGSSKGKKGGGPPPGHGKGKKGGGRGRSNPHTQQRFEHRRTDSHDSSSRNHPRRYFEYDNYYPNDGVRRLHFEENSAPSLMQMEIPPPLEETNVVPPVVTRNEPEPDTAKPVQGNPIVSKPVQTPIKAAQPEVATPTAKNIKTEKPESKSSSSEDSSDSDEEEVEKLKKDIVKKIKKEPAEKKLPSPTSSESSEFESDSENEQEEKKSEEDIVCLGAVENFEDLVSDDNSKDKEKNKVLKICGLCDKKVSFLGFICDKNSLLY